MSNRSINLTDSLYDYLLAVSLREPEILKELRARTAKLSAARMQISPEQGQFMHWLVSLIGARRTLEVGVFTGYSSLITALALPSDGQIVACDISAEYTDIAREYWQRAGVAERIDLQLRPALETLQQLLDNGEANSYDFAFIDADKENYVGYYEAVLQLLRRGGVLLVDNVLWSGRVIDAAVNDSSTVALREFNLKLHNDQRVAISLLPVGDGLTLVRKL
ncbi:MAG TPA: class I SAM-dependent methyltransferase [Spongiibacteraceae bacterium]|nr:class I SAM-dependent methyltransferase [Spongiibacteraceae bacterium]